MEMMMKEEREEESSSSSSNLSQAFSSCLRGTPRSFSVLCKRLTCLRSSYDRARFAFNSFHRVCGEANSGCDWKTTCYTAQFAYMVQVFTMGWDESEYPIVL